MNAITMKPVLCMALTIMMLMSFQGGAQIGINTQTPDASAALDIQPSSVQPNSGLLIPRLNQAQRTVINNPARGLLVFDMTDNLFYVNHTALTHDWFALNPWRTKASSATSGATNNMYTHSSINNVGIGIASPAYKLDVAGDIRSSATVTAQTVSSNSISTNSISVNGFATNAMVPTGAIIMWSGNTLPAGWAYCDGTAGRPDLRGRFIVGYDPGSPTAPAVLSGTATANVTNYGTIGNRGGENAHVLNVPEMPGHTHNVSASSPESSFNFGGPGNTWIGNGTSYSGDPYNLTINISETSKGGDQPHESRPPYYVLAYIIKL